jgi:3',5'-cyclic-AMP phosphodiesterase
MRRMFPANNRFWNKPRPLTVLEGAAIQGSKEHGMINENLHLQPVPNAGDGIDRRQFLSCMAWAGTGLLWSIVGGVPAARLLAEPAGTDSVKRIPVEDFSFVQISDSHIGFNKGANPDVSGTLRKAIERANAHAQAAKAPDFMLHTGDITQNSKAVEFDSADELNKGFRGEVFYVPGEHDFIDDGIEFKRRFGKGTVGNGWYSFNHKGVHFVGLNNCVQVDSMGNIGSEQLAWLKSDLSDFSPSTPMIVFAHIPLWMVYEKWGWGTRDGAEALSLLKRFGSVTVLNGHIHQVMQKVEGNLTFHTAMSTAFPQPAPGSAPNPGPMTVPAGSLESVIGVTEVKLARGHAHLAVIDHTLDQGV